MLMPIKKKHEWIKVDVTSGLEIHSGRKFKLQQKWIKGRKVNNSRLFAIWTSIKIFRRTIELNEEKYIIC